MLTTLALAAIGALRFFLGRICGWSPIRFKNLTEQIDMTSSGGQHIGQVFDIEAPAVDALLTCVIAHRPPAALGFRHLRGVGAERRARGSAPLTEWRGISR